MMNIDMGDKFQKLKIIIDNIEHYYFEMDKEYVGPVNPVSIVKFGSSSFSVNVLILTESVPAFYLPFNLDANHLEAVTVYLDANFDLRYYDAQSRELKGLSLLVGDPEYSYDGTVQGASEFFKNKNWSFTVLS